MASGFGIAITATDSASAQIDAINKKLAAMNAPVARLQKSLADFSRLSGVQRVSQGIERMARASLDAFRNIARVVSPLAAITGAASIAGMYRLVEAWGQWGSQLGFTAQRIGISAAQLQAFQGAGLLAGASTQAVTSGVQALGQTMYDAIGGRAPEAVALFNQLGIAFDDGTRHARSVTQVLPEIANRIAAIKDPFTQARIAVALFGGAGEEMLPFLRRGAAGIAELEERTRRYGLASPAAVAAANRLREAQANLTLAVSGLGNAVAERLAPVLAPMLTQMADWIASNRQWIATGITDRISEFAGVLKTIDWAGLGHDFDRVASTINAIVQGSVGWKNVLEGIVAIKLAGWALSAIAPFTTVLRLMALIPGSGVTSGMLAAVGLGTVALTGAGIGGGNAGSFRAGKGHVYGPDETSGGSPTGSISGWFDRQLQRLGIEGGDPSKMPGSGSAKSAYDYFISQGWSAAAAAGIVANIQAESGFNAGQVGDSGNAYGLGQWHGPRQAAFARWAGHDIRQSTYAEQLAFYNHELRDGEDAGARAAGRMLRNIADPYQAGGIVSQYGERPKAVAEALVNRGTLATGIFGKFADGSPGATGKVDVGIHVHGHGVQRVTASSSGNVNPPKVMSPAVGVTGASGS
jgi:hypothetical protein